MIKSVLYRFGCWLEVRAAVLQDMAERLQSYARPQRAPINDDLGRIILTTLANRKGALVDNVLRNNALMARLKKHG